MNGSSYLTEAGSAGDLIIRSLNRHADRTAFIIGDREASYREVRDRISRAIQLFDHLGLQKGDTVAQFALNSPEQWYVTAACYLAGLRSVTLHPGITTVEEQAWVITFSEARLFVCDIAFADRLPEYRARCPGQRLWYSHDALVPGAVHLWERASRFTPQPLVNRAGPEDIVRLGFTSGTTGPRKAVLLSSRAIAAMAVVNVTDAEWPDAPRVLCAEAIAGGFGNMILPAFLRGGTFILQRNFDAGDYLDEVNRRHPSVLLCMPWTLHALLSTPRTRDTDWSALQLLIYSGATLAPDAMHTALSVFGPVLCQVHGQTECPKSIAILRRFEHLGENLARQRSLGMPCSGVTVAVLDVNGNPCGVGEPGELCVRGPVTASGYWKQDELTNWAMRGNWWHTGDLCRVDEDGYLYFVDRLEESVMLAGATIHPKMVEDVLAAHPAVASAAAFKVRRSHRADALQAAVTLHESKDVSAQELCAMVKNQLRIELAGVHIVNRLPVLPIGRIDKAALRARFGEE